VLQSHRPPLERNTVQQITLGEVLDLTGPTVERAEPTLRDTQVFSRSVMIPDFPVSPGLGIPAAPLLFIGQLHSKQSRDLFVTGFGNLATGSWNGVFFFHRSCGISTLASSPTCPARNELDCMGHSAWLCITPRPPTTVRHPHAVVLLDSVDRVHTYRT
jgi:hypothetical protein